MKIKKLLFFPLTSLFVFGGIFSLVVPAQAAGSLTIEGGGQTFVIPANEINSWGGKFTIQEFSNLRLRVPPLRTLLENYAGLKITETPTTLEYNFDPERVYTWVEGISTKFNDQATEPKLILEDNRVQEFVPPEPGRMVDAYQSSLALLDTLQAGKTEATLVIAETAPQTPLKETNSLGINELVAQGVSNFAGSPSNRRHNIRVGVEKMKGVIIAPGEEFSFNEHLGPVEASEGYLPELVIKAEGTIPELGGGLCQVSSTVFRAAMKAGFPITQRRQHAYAVKYYAPQGTDATIYPGVIDLKFVNDTPAHILVWAKIHDNYILTFDFYGTKDDRQVTLDTPVQFDKKSDGSMKATWKRTLVKNGESQEEIFRSTYRSPALYQKREEFVPATPEPGTQTPPAAPGETPPSSPPASPLLPPAQP